jgi:hypothetical protein
VRGLGSSDTVVLADYVYQFPLFAKEPRHREIERVDLTSLRILLDNGSIVSRKSMGEGKGKGFV